MRDVRNEDQIFQFLQASSMHFYPPKNYKNGETPVTKNKHTANVLTL